jgi:hypothetical protein
MPVGWLVHFDSAEGAEDVELVEVGFLRLPGAAAPAAAVADAGAGTRVEAIWRKGGDRAYGAAFFPGTVLSCHTEPFVGWLVAFEGGGSEMVEVGALRRQGGAALAACVEEVPAGARVEAQWSWGQDPRYGEDFFPGTVEAAFAPRGVGWFVRFDEGGSCLAEVGTLRLLGAAAPAAALADAPVGARVEAQWKNGRDDLWCVVWGGPRECACCATGTLPRGLCDRHPAVGKLQQLCRQCCHLPSAPLTHTYTHTRCCLGRGRGHFAGTVTRIYDQVAVAQGTLSDLTRCCSFCIYACVFGFL